MVESHMVLCDMIICTYGAFTVISKSSHTKLTDNLFSHTNLSQSKNPSDNLPHLIKWLKMWTNLNNYHEAQIIRLVLVSTSPSIYVGRQFVAGNKFFLASTLEDDLWQSSRDVLPHLKWSLHQL